MNGQPSALDLCKGIEVPPGYRFAEFHLSRLDDVLQLLNTCAHLVYGKNAWLADELRMLWTAPSADPARDAIVVLGPDGQVVGFEEFFNHSNRIILQCMGNQVHPTHRGRGIELALLDWVVRRAENEAALADPEMRVLLRAPVGLRDNATLAVMEQAGFGPIRYYLTMCKDLTQPIAAPTWPPGVSIETLAEASARRRGPARAAASANRPVAAPDPETAAAFYRTRWLAFQDHWGVPVPFEEVLAHLQHEIATDSRFDATLSWGVFEEEHPDRGPIAICFSYPHYEGDDDAGFVSDLGTLPEHRRRSLARSLLLHCFQEQARRGRRSVYLHVDADSPTGAVGLYEGVGMEVTERIAILAREIRPGRDPFQR